MGLTLTDARATVKEFGRQGHGFDADLSAPQAGVIATLVRWLGASSEEIPFSQFLKRALESSWDEARHTGNNLIETEHLLLGILDVQDCRGLEVLRQHGIDIIKLRETLTA